MNKSLAISLGVTLSFGVAGVAAAAKPAPRPTPVEPPTYYDSAGAMMGPAWTVEGVDAVLLRFEGRVFTVQVDRASAGYGANWVMNQPVYFSGIGCFGEAYLNRDIATGMSTAAAVQYSNANQDILLYVSFTPDTVQASVSSVMSYDPLTMEHRCQNGDPVTIPLLAVAQRYQINSYKPPFVIR